MIQFLTFQEWMESKTEDTPDNSLDQWIQSVKHLGAQVDSLISQAKKDEDESDKKIEKKKQEIEKSEKEDKKKEDKPEKEDDYGRPEDRQKGKTVPKRLPRHKESDSD